MKGMLGRGKCDSCRMVFIWGKIVHITETKCPNCGNQLKKHCWERKLDREYKLYSCSVNEIRRTLWPSLR